jgi:polysaccharide deacetylase 2 family uncharacterized protein YibQ
MSHKVLLKVCIGAATFLLILIVVCIIGIYSKKQKIATEPVQEASISDAVLLDMNLQNLLKVHNVTTLKNSTTDTISASKIWFVPNGISIPNYMLRAAREIERCKGKIHWMREIRNGTAAILKYEGEQGVYPLTEIRIIDSLMPPNSSKLAVILAVKEQNRILKNNPNLLEKLNFNYNLLILSSRPEFLQAAKKTSANIIPWIPMESHEIIYDMEKKNLIPLGIINQKELSEKLDEQLRKFNNVNGFAAFYGEDFLIHPASVDVFINVLLSKNLWFLDLTKKGTASLLSPSECLKKNIRCQKDVLLAESETQITNALKEARIKGKAILLFELTEKSINLLENLPAKAEKQGTGLVNAEEVF